MKKVLLPFLLCFHISLFTGQTIYPDYMDGRLYVKMNSGLLGQAISANPRNIPVSKLECLGKLASKYGITKASRPFYQASDDPTLPYVIKIEFLKAADVNALIKDLEMVRGVGYAEKVPLMKTDVLPNDPVFPAQLTQINAANAWGVFNGNSNITVAIVDNAVMWTHQDLVANTYTNTGEIAGNAIDDDQNGYIDDVNGWDVADNDNNAIPTNTLMDHGTHCAGIAGARTDNASGIASIGWNIKIIPVKATANGSSTTSIDDGYAGIIYAAKAKARIISCSWGGSGFSSTEQNVINYAWIKGCLIIAAAGNNSTTTPNYPGAYANVYCVASVGSTEAKSGFSNFGSWVDIAAPGESIYSTLPSATTGTFGYKSGTSMATPLVAGLAGLMLSNCPFMTQSDVINCISSTAVNIYTVSANATYSTGLQLGAGRIEAFLAMNCATGFLTIPPVANFFAFPLNTCPNTPITFYDSSLYLPTSRSWTFQGGTPATSTSLNPVVQWTTPGTYSVALTVSNTNGTNTATKISYVTVAGPIALPFSEGFENPVFLPAGWSPNNIYSDNAFWARTTATGAYGTSTACALFDNYNFDATGGRDEMRSPKYDFSNVATAQLNFDVAYARYNASYSDSLEVKVSTNCGLTWSSIYLKGGTTLATAPDLTAYTFTPGTTQWRTESINISTLTAGQGNVMFSFINRGHYGQPIYLDNINLSFPSPNVSMQVSSPPYCEGGSLTFTNTSVAAPGYTWSFPGGSPVSSSAQNPTVTYPVSGSYNAYLIGANGTSTAVASLNFSITAGPSISINSPSICQGSPVTLLASGASNYTWTSGPNTNTFSVAPSVTTVYTVTGNSGMCDAIKTVTVYVTPPPTITVNSPTICSGATAIITPTGGATYIWLTPPVTLTAAVLAIAPAVTTVYSYTAVSGACSIPQTVTVTVNAQPTLSINSASICQGSSATLSVSGATSYSWNTGAAGNTLPVTPAATTAYTVTGTTLGCSATATASVFVENQPTVSIAAAQTTMCSGMSLTLTASGASSYSWSGGATTNSLVVTPSVSTFYTVYGTNTLCTGSTNIAITVMAPPPLLVSAIPVSVCQGNSATLTASGSYSSFVWAGPNGTLSSTVVNPLLNTTYTVTAYGNAGCNTSSMVSLPVNANPTPTLLAIIDASCSTCPSGGATVTPSGGTAPYNYTWTPSGGNQNTINGLLPGCYTVTIADLNSCRTQTVACISTTVFTSLNKNAAGTTLHIYPNPAQHLVNIEHTGRNFDCKLFDNLGRMVLQTQHHTDNAILDVSTLSKGVYLLEVTSGNNGIWKKLLIE